MPFDFDPYDSAVIDIPTRPTGTSGQRPGSLQPCAAVLETDPIRGRATEPKRSASFGRPNYALLERIH